MSQPLVDISGVHPAAADRLPGNVLGHLVRAILAGLDDTETESFISFDDTAN
ncbi:hypothetical protein LO762_28785 [Actinocorallia sp. API 0066]|uniref:hypothetical protein n=1 Tax=Actinocorallia sp. API 0066 TaxID=2896846 RepID=UPI001E620794|nr:hypothetical protein [Actinocorallia sp. API 0066]MCD0453146.1 hypothetical protein [Actinocorallia sp. API 0066]